MKYLKFSYPFEKGVIFNDYCAQNYISKILRKTLVFDHINVVINAVIMK